MSARRFAVTIGAALGLLISGSAAALQDASPVASPAAGPGLPAGCSVVASGLVNPRFVAVGPDGTIYVSESGTGGDEAVVQTTGEAGATPVAGNADEAPAENRGFSGQVTQIAPDGTQSVLASGLPSYAMGMETTGPAGIAVAADGTVILAVGGAGPATAYTEALPNENSVVSIDPATGEVTLLSDIGAYERASNPDPFNIDSNLYGVTVADDGTIYVNDAGGNATYSVPAGGGDPVVLAVHPGLSLPEGMEAPPGGNPGRGGANELDPVPTGIAAVDGAVLVGYLSGGPFPPGAAKIVRVALDGTISDVAAGLTMVVGVATGPDGQLYASQISTNFLQSPPAPGNVVRVLGDGSQEVVVDGLMLPNGIAFDQNGNLLVVVGAVGGPNGQLLSCEGIGAAASSGESEVAVTLNDVFFRPF
jgi:sugar lactone lactonase YvrE